MFLNSIDSVGGACLTDLDYSNSFYSRYLAPPILTRFDDTIYKYYVILLQFLQENMSGLNNFTRFSKCQGCLENLLASF